MDWRERDYYLIMTDWQAYEMRHEYYRIAAPSIKYHTPYSHFKNNGKKWKAGSVYDGCSELINDKHFYPQEMVSCRKCDSDALEYELRKAHRNDGWSNYMKLTKEMCGQ